MQTGISWPAIARRLSEPHQPRSARAIADEQVDLEARVGETGKETKRGGGPRNVEKKGGQRMGLRAWDRQHAWVACARAIARESDAGALGRIRQLLLGPGGGRKCVAAEIER